MKLSGIENGRGDVLIGRALSYPSDGDQVVAESSTLEVRWIRPGLLEAETIHWFERFVGKTESREDAYLLVPMIDGLSVKIRGDQQLDVKLYRGSSGALEIPGRARGRLDHWQKWSFPLGAESRHTDDSAAWRRVRKARNIGWFGATQEGPQGASRLDENETCAVELTQITIGEQPWWTLGLEASGPPGSRRATLEAAANLVFDEPSRFGERLGLDDSRTYSEWLHHQIDRT